MDQTNVIFHRDYQIGQVDSRIFGGFLEHIGRAVYEGVYDPQSRQTDEQGFRKDVLSSLKNLGFTVMRYPGGILPPATTGWMGLDRSSVQLYRIQPHLASNLTNSEQMNIFNWFAR